MCIGGSFAQRADLKPPTPDRSRHSVPSRFGPNPASFCSWVGLAFERSFEFSPQLFAVGQVKLVFRDEELVVHAGQGVFDQGVILRGESRMPTGGLSSGAITLLRYQLT